MSIWEDGFDMADDEMTGSWPPAQGKYTLEDRLLEGVEYLRSRARRLTVKYYDDILAYAANRNKRCEGFRRDRSNHKDWKGMGKYPNYWAIELIFKVPFQDLPLHISYPLDDSCQDSCDPLKELVAQWRLEHGI